MTRLDPRLATFARDMRTAQTPPERALWQRLRNSKLGGYKFRRQAVLEPWIADFFCPAKGLIVELDGDTHEAERDARRDADLLARGFTTLRFGNQSIGRNLDGVTTTILAKLEALPDRWQNPPLQGRVGETRGTRGPGVGGLGAQSGPHPRAGFAVSRPSPEGEGW
ncbi:endonuclease domain-containing protein [Glacieibacterium frigidum]|uniref:endonuclease domain-containing protein n=1 Tax=Glacieibacterium frigidum TaxID=2593303 RepID=UPI001F18206D|nr:DUF559 domain-containing protein [Glacieibacterium frigidum]